MTEFGAFLKAFIYLISSSLLYPVLFLLVIFILCIIIFTGMFCAEWLERRRSTPCEPQDLPGFIKNEEKETVYSYRVRRYIQILRRMVHGGKADETIIENLLRHSSLELWKSLDALRICIRVGPALGLLGTLIPMGTGLAALGQGDMSRLSADLTIAFTTTVVGLFGGTVAFLLHTIRERWVQEDIKNIELATELLSEEKGI